MENQKKPVVLFAILNWGLGHASRSVPVIQFLQAKGYQIVICTDGQIIDFLQKECEDLIFEYLPAYKIRYNRDSMVYNMLTQLPKLYSAFVREHRKFSDLVEKYAPDFCISDNRYGCFSKTKPSFFIGHQWNILRKSGKIHSSASKMNHFFIKKFDALLIPDSPEIKISGKLTQRIKGIKSYYLGILSRFSALEPSSKDISVLCILSGPEPARSRFEKQITEYFGPRPDHNTVIIRGTQSKRISKIPSHILTYDLVEGDKLKKLIGRAEYIISRSGYSSIMDYISLGVEQAILVPTPGQTEQIFLAKKMKDFSEYNMCIQKRMEACLDKIKPGEESPRPAEYIHKIIANNNILSVTWEQLKMDFDL